MKVAQFSNDASMFRESGLLSDLEEHCFTPNAWPTTLSLCRPSVPLASASPGPIWKWCPYPAYERF